MILIMIMTKSMWREAGEEQTYTYLNTLHWVTRAQGKIVIDIISTVTGQ